MKVYSIAHPYIDRADIRGVVAVMKSGALSLGSKYLDFEQAIAKFTKVKYACAVVNGTAGLHLAVRSLGLSEGDEVITTPLSFISSTTCLLFERIKPVFVDIEEKTFTLDADKIEGAITTKTKAILPVHLFGRSANMPAIMRLARHFKLKVIEDACESMGTKIDGRHTGTFGDVGVIAFYPNKQMTTAEGGIVITNQKKIYELCRSLRNQGRNSKDEWLVHERLGYNYRMNELNASLGVTQLKKLSWMIKEKQQIVRFYNQTLSGIPDLELPFHNEETKYSWFVYLVRVTNGKRDLVIDELAKRKIQAKPYFPVIHLQPFIKEKFDFKKGDFPTAEKIASQGLALPFYIGLSQKDIKYICFQLKAVLASL